MTMTREQVAALLDGTTPGPWQVEAEWNVGNNHISIMHGSISVESDSESAANAKLTAAAPDLARQLLAAMDRLADADMAQAALVERAAGIADAEHKDRLRRQSAWALASGSVTGTTMMHGQVSEAMRALAIAIRALAPDAGVKGLAALRAERDSFRAVLEGAEYGDIDGIAKYSPEVSRHLGRLVGDMTKQRIADRDRLAAEARKQVEGMAKLLRQHYDCWGDVLPPAKFNRLMKQTEAALAALPAPPGGEKGGE